MQRSAWAKLWERENSKIKIKGEIRKVKATEVIIVGDFNEYEHSKNMQESTVEIELHDAFRKVHNVEKK